MGVFNRFIGGIAGVSVLGVLLTALKFGNNYINKVEAKEAAALRQKKRKENAERERRRVNSDFSFDEICSEKDFQAIAEWASYRIKGLEIQYFDGPIIQCRVSAGKKKSWCFTADFNDFGKLSGLWWTSSEHEVSSIPEYYAGLIEEQINLVLRGKRPSYLDKPYDPEKDRFKVLDDAQISELEAKAKAKAAKLKKLKKNRKYIIAGAAAVLILLGFLAAFVIGKIGDRQKMTDLPVASYELVGMSSEDACEILGSAGFTNLTIVPLTDLKYSELSLNGTVEYVSVKGSRTFRAGEDYPYDREIRIGIHSPAEVVPPVFNSGTKGKDRSEIAKLFADAGFGDIRLVAEPDLVNGWLTKENTVKSIEINGRTDYKPGVKFPIDAEVVITYHTFK